MGSEDEAASDDANEPVREESIDDPPAVDDLVDDEQLEKAIDALDALFESRSDGEIEEVADEPSVPPPPPPPKKRPPPRSASASRAAAPQQRDGAREPDLLELSGKFHSVEARNVAPAPQAVERGSASARPRGSMQAVLLIIIALLLASNAFLLFERFGPPPELAPPVAEPPTPAEHRAISNEVPRPAEPALPPVPGAKPTSPPAPEPEPAPAPAPAAPAEVVEPEPPPAPAPKRKPKRKPKPAPEEKAPEEKAPEEKAPEEKAEPEPAPTPDPFPDPQ